MRRILLAVLAVCAAAAVVPAGANPITHDPCSDLSVTTDEFYEGLPFGSHNVLENLGFDGLGNLWVSDSSAGLVLRMTPAALVTLTIPVASPGALTMSPAGEMYVNVGNGLPGALQRSHAAGVAKFDPASASPSLTTVASGLNMANGGTFDAAGNYYASNDVDYGLTKIEPDGTVHQDWSHVWGTNGLVVTGGALYAAITFDQRSPIARIPLDDSAHPTVAKQTTFGVLSLEPAVYTEPDLSSPLVGLKGLDDMTLGPDGRLWAVANGMGELLRIDLATGAVCLVASGLHNPSSVRFSRSFGSYSDAADLFVTQFGGAITHVHLG